LSGGLIEDTVGAVMVGSGTKRVRTFPSGRTCDEPGCRVRLSIYSGSSSCGLHAHFEPTGHGAQPTIRLDEARRFGGFGASKVAT
jgi:hypothetical protein